MACALLITMVIDGHCHAWSHWPYDPPVPDPEHRGGAEQLILEMDQHGVDRALVVCARIRHNPENNAYVADQVARFPERLRQVADLDSFWTSTYHQPGAALRLRDMAARWPLSGFTHYLNETDDHWLGSEEADALFVEAGKQRLLASIHCRPHLIAAVCRLAARHPETPVLLHHLGHAQANDPSTVDSLLACAPVENVHVKVSGFYYCTAGPGWDFPCRDVQSIVRRLYETLGAGRLCWGSDYPVVRRFLTYRQALEIVRTHCDFIPAAEQALVLGGTLDRLLGNR